MTEKSYPLVSIVTPTYNQAAYLEQTIASVLAQDYPNIEYIVINDGSTDYTEEVLRKFKGKITSFTHENCGQAATLNKGWSLCQGKYIGYVSSDDILYTTAISDLVAALEISTVAEVVYCDYDIINEKGRLIKTFHTEEYNNNRLVKDLVCQPGLGALFKRELFKQSGGWKTQLQQVPDFEFWLRIAKHTRFQRVPKVLGAFRVHEGSTSFKKMTEERANEILKVVIEHDECKKNKKSIANAYLLSAKNHFQAQRLLKGFASVANGCYQYPFIILKLSTWRLIVTSILRRSFYKLC